MTNWLEPFLKMEPGGALQSPSGVVFCTIDEDAGRHSVGEERFNTAYLTPIQLQELAQIINALYPQEKSDGES